MTSACGVIIVGGAVHGASVAYHLATDPAFDGSVLLIEKDPGFALGGDRLDLTPLGFARISLGQPLTEENVV